MHIDIWGLVEEVLDGPVIKILLQSADSGSSKDNVSDPLLAHKLGDGMCDAPSFHGEDLRIEIARELHIFIERVLLVLFPVAVCLYVENIQLAAYTLSDACATGDQHL